jgi:hypothetical protein
MKRASWIICGLIILAAFSVSIDPPSGAAREVAGIVRGTTIHPSDTGPSTQIAAVALTDGSSVNVSYEGLPLRSGESVRLNERKSILGRRTYELVRPVEEKKG